MLTIIFFVFNILIAFLLLFSPFFWSRLFFIDKVNPITIPFIFALPVEFFKIFVGPFFLLESIFDVGYQLALLINSLQILISSIIIILVARFMPILKPTLKLKNFGFAIVEFRRATVFFLFFSILFFIILASITGGVVEWVLNPREAYISKRNGNGLLYSLSVGFFLLSYFTSILYNQSKKEIFLKTFYYLFTAYIFGSKGVFFNILICTSIILWKNGEVNLLKYIFSLLTIAITYAILNLIFGSGFDIDSIINYFDIFLNGANFYNDYLNGYIHLFDGDVLLSSYWAWVPRSYWENKPYVYGLLHLNEHYFPGAAELGNTPAFGGGVKEFSDFGFVGVFLYSILDPNIFFYSYYLKLISRLDLLRNTNEITVYNLLLLMIFFSPRFGDQFIGPAFIIYILFIFCILLAISRMSGNRPLKANT